MGILAGLDHAGHRGGLVVVGNNSGRLGRCRCSTRLEGHALVVDLEVVDPSMLGLLEVDVDPVEGIGCWSSRWMNLVVQRLCK